MIGEMLSVIGLAAHGAPPALIDVWAQHVQDLTDVQERAVRAGVLDGVSNLLVVAPTSRRLLLVPIPMLAEALVRCGEGRLSAEGLGDLLATARGILGDEDLRSSPQPIPQP
jgi:hypothetical protein